MPNRLVFNEIAQNLKVQLYGYETGVPINVDSEGNVNITGNLTISVTSPLMITGTVGLNDNTVVGISGQPTLVMGGRVFTEIVQTTSVNLTTTGVTSIYTDGIDVLPYDKYSYYVAPSLTNMTSVTVQQQIAMTNSSDNFINSPLTAVVITNNNGGLANAQTCMQYSRLEVKLNVSTTPVTGDIIILFQGHS